MKLLSKLALLISLIVLLIGCGQETHDQTSQPDSSVPATLLEDDTSTQLAEVNGQLITQKMLEAYADERGVAISDVKTQEQALKNLMDLIMLEQNAKEQGMAKSLDVHYRLQVKSQTLLSNLLIEDFILANPVSDAAVRAEYDDQVNLAGDAQYHLHHILLGNVEEAQAVLQQMADGRSFMEIEEDFNQVKGNESGDLGWVDFSQIPQALVDALKTMNKGDVSTQPVQSPYGFHILYVEDTRQRVVPAFDKVSQAIRNNLQRKQVEAYVASLRSKASINREVSQKP